MGEFILCSENLQYRVYPQIIHLKVSVWLNYLDIFHNWELSQLYVCGKQRPFNPLVSLDLSIALEAM